MKHATSVTSCAGFGCAHLLGSGSQVAARYRQSKLTHILKDWRLARTAFTTKNVFKVKGFSRGEMIKASTCIVDIVVQVGLGVI